MGEHSIFGHNSGHERKTCHHALKHGTNLVLLALQYDPANHTSLHEKKSKKVTGIAGFSVLRKLV